MCSASVALLLKSASAHGLPQFPLFATNYVVAFALGVLISEQNSVAAEPRAAIVLAAATGLLYVLGFLVFRRTIHEIGTGIATSVSRLSVTGPVVLSVIVFGEAVGAFQAAGIVLAVAVLPLSGRVWPPWRRAGSPTIAVAARSATPAPPATPVTPPTPITRSTQPRSPTAAASATQAPAAGGAAAVRDTGVLWPIALFLVFAINDGVLKIRTELLPTSDAGLFFAVLFGTAGILSATIAAARGESVRPATLMIGVPLGAVNYGTAFFLSRALEHLAGYQAFTLNSVGVILVVVVASRLLYGERLERHNHLFLAGSVAAIVLLRVPFG